MQTLQGVPWEDLAVLLAALDERSLNRAAGALGIGQSTASRRLARLEGRLGARLFDRTPEGLLPTDLALRLAPHARLIEGHMADIGRLAAGLSEAPRGRIRLASPDGLASSILFDRLPEFFARYPEIDLDVLVGQAVLDLVRREADIAIRFVKPTQPDLVCAKLGHIDVLPHIHPRLLGTPPEALRWLTFTDPTFPETRWVHEHVRPERVMRFSLWNAIFAAAEAGLGAALLSPIVATPAGLVPLQGLPPVPGRDAWLVYHRALRDVPRIAVFRRWLVGVARSFLDAPVTPL